MANEKDAPPAGRAVRETEIFREPPGSGNYSSSIGAAQGIELFSGRGQQRRPRPAKTVREAARDIPVFAETDVLVVGGGPSGTAAAIAAAGTGADVVLLERDNHLGGLSTGGLVIWIDRMTDWSGKQVIRGIANELLDRLPKDAVAGPPRGEWGSADEATAAYWKERTAAYHGIVTWSPTVDPEASEAGHRRSWCWKPGAAVASCLVRAPIDARRCGRGRDLREQGGPQAIRAAVTIDAPAMAIYRARRCRLRGRYRRRRYPPLHQHGVPVRRRRHGALARLQDQRPDDFAAFMDRGRACG